MDNVFNAISFIHLEEIWNWWSIKREKLYTIHNMECTISSI